MITIDELLLAGGVVTGRSIGQGQHVVVDGLIVVGKVAGDVDAVGTRHAVFAGGTGNGGEA